MAGALSIWALQPLSFNCTSFLTLSLDLGPFPEGQPALLCSVPQSPAPHPLPLPSPAPPILGRLHSSRQRSVTGGSSLPAPPPASSPGSLQRPPHSHSTLRPPGHSLSRWGGSRPQVQSRQSPGEQVAALGPSPSTPVGSHVCPGHCCPIRSQGATRHW